jgi:hypothetical protein
VGEPQWSWGYKVSLLLLACKWLAVLAAAATAAAAGGGGGASRVTAAGFGQVE